MNHKKNKAKKPAGSSSSQQPRTNYSSDEATEPGLNNPVPKLNSHQVSVSLDNLNESVQQWGSILSNMNENFSKCSNALNKHNSRLNKVEEYLAGFENIFTMFQQLLQQQVKNQLETFQAELAQAFAAPNTTISDTTTVVCQNCSSSSAVQLLTTTSTPTNDCPTIQHSIADRIERLEDTIRIVSDETVRKTTDSTAEKQALLLKREILADWNDSLNNRRRGHWNYLQNKSKQALYQRWQKEDPAFLPLKFRPHLSPNTDHQVRNLKLQAAYQSYNNSIKEMGIYEATHKSRYKEIDSKMIDTFQKLSADSLIQQKLTELWNTDTANQEARSIQIWNKKERFLNRKKHEDSQQSGDEPWTKARTPMKSSYNMSNRQLQPWQPEDSTRANCC